MGFAHVTRNDRDGLEHRFYAVCDSCGAQFGGPAAGDYIDAPSSMDIEDFLRNEALSIAGWIEVSAVTTGLVCSPKCAKKWITENC